MQTASTLSAPAPWTGTLPSCPQPWQMALGKLIKGKEHIIYILIQCLALGAAHSFSET